MQCSHIPLLALQAALLWVVQVWVSAGHTRYTGNAVFISTRQHSTYARVAGRDLVCRRCTLSSPPAARDSTSTVACPPRRARACCRGRLERQTGACLSLPLVLCHMEKGAAFRGTKCHHKYLWEIQCCCAGEQFIIRKVTNRTEKTVANAFQPCVCIYVSVCVCTCAYMVLNPRLPYTCVLLHLLLSFF